MRFPLRIPAIALFVLLSGLFGHTLATGLPALSSSAPVGHSPATGSSSPSSISAVDGPLGQIDLLGTTWYENQYHGSSSRMISLAPEGGLHFCWTNGQDSLAASRHVFYNYWDPGGGVRYPALGYQIDQGYRAGYCAADLFHSGEPVLAYHKQDHLDDDWDIQIYADYTEGFGGAWSTIENPSWGQICWPKMTLCNQDHIHIVGFEHSDREFERMTYTRSEDGGMTFTPWEVIDTLMMITQDIAASPVSDKVGIAYTRNISDFWDWYTWPWIYHQFNNDVILIESENGIDWDFSDRRNITRIIDPDSSRYPDTTWAGGDTLRPYNDVSLLYDREDYAHVAFTARGVWKYGPRIGPSPSGVYVTYDASMIWHYSEQHDTLTRIADGWYDVGDSDDGFNEYRGTGQGRSTVDRPCLAENPENGYLYCIYARCVQGDTSGGSEPSHGWANGEIYCSVSTDGGLNWSEGVNLTNTPSPGCSPGECFDEDYASQTRVVNDTLHIIYIEDKDAGGVVWTAPQEGIWTENPVIYQKVPADLIPPGPPYVQNYYFHVGPVGATGIEEPQRTGGNVPEESVLRQNYPNPFNATTEIVYRLPTAGHVTLKIFNTLGQEVRTMVDGPQTAGEHRVRWDGRDAKGREAASGLYFCQLKGGEFRAIIRMVLVR